MEQIDKTENKATAPQGNDLKPEQHELTLYERLDAYISKLSTRNLFWNRVCSMIWLPYAFHSGLTMASDGKKHRAILPFRRFNKNWYNAMAGASLLGNSEIAGGNYIFKVCGGEYTVVCKHLDYRFLRPCMGPAEYQMTPLEDIHELVATGKEFNIAIRMDIVQALMRGSQPRMVGGKPAKPKRVGRCTATFHVTPKAHHKAKKMRRKKTS